MQEGETVGARWVTLEQLKRMLVNGELAFGQWFPMIIGDLEKILEASPMRFEHA